METIASLIREFPFGSFLIITGIIAGCVTVAKTFINRNKPTCECDCCGTDDDDDDPVIEGGEEDDES